MKGYESATFIAGFAAETLFRDGCSDPSHGALTMWNDEAEHIVQALADAGLLR